MASAGTGHERGHEPDMRLPAWCALVRADNPGPMTLAGTNTWVLRPPSVREAVVVDPGPLLDPHLETVAALGPVAAVLLTHGHADHAEGAYRLHEMTGAPVLAADPAFCVAADPLLDGALAAVVGSVGLPVRVVATPGHSADSVSFLVEDLVEPAVLTGDTILGSGTTVVAHPDGRLGDYLASLQRLRSLGDLLLLPGHGPAFGSVGAMAGRYLAHRAKRLAQVQAAVEAGDRTPEAIVYRVYANVDPTLWPAAELSVRAQLDYLATLPGS